MTFKNLEFIYKDMKHIKPFEQTNERYAGIPSSTNNQKPEDRNLKHYMFFKNIENIKQMINDISSMDPEKIDKVLESHDWASDHISTSKDDIEDVHSFLKTITSK